MHAIVILCFRLAGQAASNQIASGLDALNLNQKNPELISGAFFKYLFRYEVGHSMFLGCDCGCVSICRVKVTLSHLFLNAAAEWDACSAV